MTELEKEIARFEELQAELRKSIEELREKLAVEAEELNNIVIELTK